MGLQAQVMPFATRIAGSRSISTLSLQPLTTNPAAKTAAINAARILRSLSSTCHTSTLLETLVVGKSWPVFERFYLTLEVTQSAGGKTMGQKFAAGRSNSKAMW